MATEMILGLVIVLPVFLGGAVLFVASDEWLRTFAELARSLGRPM